MNQELKKRKSKKKRRVKMIGSGLMEIGLVFIVLLLYLVPIALFLTALYYIIKNAVKKGILEAEEEKKKKGPANEKEDI